MRLESNLGASNASETPVEQMRAFTDSGMVLTQVNYKQWNVIAEARGQGFLDLLANAIKNNVRVYVIDDGMDAYWRVKVAGVIAWSNWIL